MDKQKILDSIKKKLEDLSLKKARDIYYIISLAKKALEEIKFSKIIHKMNLQPKYFNFVKNGTKRIELRLYDEKRQTIQLGDIIEFSNSENDSLEAEVVGLLRYQTFDDTNYIRHQLAFDNNTKIHFQAPYF